MSRLLSDVTKFTVSNVNGNVSYALGIRWILVVGEKFGIAYSCRDGTVNELGLIHFYSTICTMFHEAKISLIQFILQPGTYSDINLILNKICKKYF